VRDDADIRSLAQTIGSAALGVGIGVAVLLAGFWVSNLTLARSTTLALSSGAPIATAASLSGPTVTTAPSTTTASAPTSAPTATPPSSPTADPLVATAYSGQGIRLAALALPVGYTLTSPIAGTVTVIVYQFVDGEVRSGADLTDRASFPYVLIRSADREIKLRPGALNKDVQLIVKDGDTVAAGAAVFKIIGSGPSSWATFYDKGVTAQVLASVTARPQGTEVDPVPVFKR